MLRFSGGIDFAMHNGCCAALALEGARGGRCAYIVRQFLIDNASECFTCGMQKGYSHFTGSNIAMDCLCCHLHLCGVYGLLTSFDFRIEICLQFNWWVLQVAFVCDDWLSFVLIFVFV